MADLVAGARHAIGDHFRVIGVAVLEATFQLIKMRRQDEHPHQVGGRIGLLQLLGALPVDIEQHIAAIGQRRFHRCARGAITVAEHGRPFQQGVFFDHRLELVVRHEIIINAVHFTGAWAARCGRNAHGDAAVFGHQRARHGGLASTRGRGQHEHQAAPEWTAGRRAGAGKLRHLRRNRSRVTTLLPSSWGSGGGASGGVSGGGPSQSLGANCRAKFTAGSTKPTMAS